MLKLEGWKHGHLGHVIKDSEAIYKINIITAELLTSLSMCLKDYL